MVIIGEKINASRKDIGQAITSRDRTALIQHIQQQDAAGAHYIDLNAGTGSGDMDKEQEDMFWLIDIALETTEKALSIDSANPRTILKAADYIGDRRDWMINSVKNDRNLLDSLLPVARDRKVPIVCLAMGSEGIPADVKGRLAMCRVIYDAALKTRVSADQLYFDPLIMPLSSNYVHGMIALETLHTIKQTFPDAKTTVGLSNISFGLPRRSLINETFLIAALAYGLDSAICDPTNEGIRKAVLLGELFAGKDRYCRRFTRALRQGVLNHN